MNTVIPSLLRPVRQIWLQRSLRERLLLQVAAWLIGAAILWTLGLAPALRTWHEAPARQAALDQQSQQMLQWQAQATRLKTPQTLKRADAEQWLQAHISDLGPKAKLQMQGEQMQVTLDAAPAEALALWLSRAREHAHARPVQAQLQQAPASTTAPTTPTAGVAWSGTLLLSLP
jgi:general secretion pathway protein M